jgi:DNA-binding MarR family transcriptional regulator
VKTPEKYLEGYNACDGEHSVSEIASIVGVTKGTLSPILADWEATGIIYEIDKAGGKFYKKLFPV